MINTYNESTLHRDLKNEAAASCGGKTEQKVGRYICDAVAPDGAIIEIQTKSFKAIQDKLRTLLETAPVRLIYPLAVETYLEYYDKDGILLSRRKSPKKRCLYNIFDELTGIWPVLLHTNFTLEVRETVILKKRRKTPLPVQSSNKRRRHKKDWYDMDTEALSTHNTHIFSCKNDYLALLARLPENFCVQDAVKCSGAKREQAGKMLWSLYKMQLIERTGKRGKSFMYRIREDI